MISLVLTWTFFIFCSFVIAYENSIHVETNHILINYGNNFQDKPVGFHQTIDISIFENVLPSNCSNDFAFCLKWSNFGQLKITDKNEHCKDYEFFNQKNNNPLKVRFDISNVFLYGGPERAEQTWPVDYIKLEEFPYISKEIEGKKYYGQSALESYWLVSNGMYLYVDDTTPLFVTQNKGKKIFELVAEKKAPYIRKGETKLKYLICKFDNMKEAQKHAVNHVLGKPSSLPDTKMVRYPIWSTWAKYKSEINSTVILEYANSINQHYMSNSHVEIDDKWETCYGSLIVDPNRFSDMQLTVQQVKSIGFRVTIWVHPFINTNCNPYFLEAARKGYFVKDEKGSVLTTWWNGEAGYVDFTNPEAATWWYNRLKALKDATGIDSFKFDSGESNFSPQLPIFHVMREDHPETIVKTYVQTVSQFGNMIEVRSARRTQKYPIFLRMIDRRTNWDDVLGLGSMIPALLQMNIIGYPYVLPDMIGGNGYGGTVVTDELFIRWLQVNVFMPTLQFSYPPWDFGDQVVKITKKFIELHDKYTDKILQAMQKAVEEGTPVNPPIWWIDPTDPQTYEIDSEFLLGEDILVAPVVQQGARSRNIYLPKGHWKDQVRKDSKIIKGPIWLYNYPADLDVLPYFVKVDNSDDKKDKKFNSANPMEATSLKIICIAVILVYFYRLWVI